MKKFSILFALIFSVMVFSQTEKGSKFVGVSTNALTGINYSTVEDSGVKVFQIGAQGGYFLENNLAAVAGLGYNSKRVNKSTASEDFSYLVGAKYFIQSVLPVQVDYNGVGSEDYIGTQLGYAFFPSENFSVEPNARYNFALKDNYKNIFSLGIGFNYHF